MFDDLQNLITDNYLNHMDRDELLMWEVYKIAWNAADFINF